ncbi:RNA polymerase sigma factor [Labrenzia sp. VG12]|uniref:RNA polymerase sigma factor n=1 Tax=Labrenzia sp. VG12 TaxID=2021862 RepID=UPI0012FD1D95|nr:helix-turn-helix domain-containing protein [Labrenzia sp. VG12]
MTAITVSSEQVAAAQEGDREALENVLSGVQDQIHQLARRILVNPDDASEATQEILILVLTKLSTFRGTAPFPPGSTGSRSAFFSAPGKSGTGTSGSPLTPLRRIWKPVLSQTPGRP